MELSSLFFVLATERDEGAIKIHRREGEQAKEGFLVDQSKNVCHPRLRAQVGLSESQIQPS
jgi:hypothetical protein